MKYILLIMLFVLSSCVYQEEAVISNSGERIPFTGVTHFTYEGHEYIKFEEANGNATFGGVVHNPNCKYCRKDSEK